MTSRKFGCDTIYYRKGFVEITPGIHGNCVNLECWQIHNDLDISGMDLLDQRISDESITANVELELSLETAEALVVALQDAIYAVRASGNVS